MSHEFNKEEQELLRAMGKVFKQLRINAGYERQEDFSTDVIMPRSQYQEYETGVNMKIISIMRLVSHHNLNIKEFLSLVYDEIKKNDNSKIRKININ